MTPLHVVIVCQLNIPLIFSNPLHCYPFHVTDEAKSYGKLSRLRRKCNAVLTIRYIFRKAVRPIFGPTHTHVKVFFHHNSLSLSNTNTLLLSLSLSLRIFSLFRFPLLLAFYHPFLFLEHISSLVLMSVCIISFLY